MRNPTLSLRDLLWALVCIASLGAAVLLLGFSTGSSPSNDIEEINALLDDFEEAYSAKRVNDLRRLFYADAVVAYDAGGVTQRVRCLEDWLQNTEEGVFALNEHISDSLTDREIVVYRNIAYTVCDYTYRGDARTTRGVDIFTFLKMRDRWRILSLQWTGDEVR